VAVIFHGLVADLTAESLGLAALFPPGGAARTALAEIVAVPETNAADLDAVSDWIAQRYTSGGSSGTAALTPAASPGPSQS
jgi:hypothetical protein